ncbi:MAG: HlyD family secretion protein [Chlorobium sp.]|jgi:membrane fusion protein (multidrug efflux system)|uniref:HlyD family secretion protein n=1 Tax=Chlorobium sp. TaxID=1095 RepID=UPI0025BE3E42|nr:HlyD family secretion protein [Chlorobium sp.]MCF8216372.1 HlyD family secretion protein [Chlorobium sp.]MCF8271275.1 HlyD family secretion protein [Chlorobium sp.]MCF8287649.1 HlyD family secretion protein [Chlorobium sp.]MCF8291188.1 HlyD family secretion protein [Chlorobium sp.]MCF8385283.1 HlyD family secretion protein [Chlorobium sp.]
MAEQEISHGKTAAAKESPKASNPLRLVIAAVVVLGALLWGGSRVYHSFLYVETDNAQIEGDVYPVISRIPGRVQQVFAADNQLVAKGDTLALLDPADYEVRLAMASAALDNAKASVAAAGEAATAAAATRRKLGADLRRSESLRRQDVISPSEFDAVHAAATASSAQYSASESQRKAAEAQVELREAELRNARLQLSYTAITAPAAGHVSKKNIQPGQYVAPGQQLIALVGSSDLWVVANFKETQLENIRPGQSVTIRVDAYPGEEFEGKVESLSAGTGSRFALLPPDNASGNFVKVAQRVPVKIVFTDNPGSDVKLAAGMNVIVEIRVK